MVHRADGTVRLSTTTGRCDSVQNCRSALPVEDSQRAHNNDVEPAVGGTREKGPAPLSLVVDSGVVARLEGVGHVELAALRGYKKLGIGGGDNTGLAGERCREVNGVVAAQCFDFGQISGDAHEFGSDRYHVELSPERVEF